MQSCHAAIETAIGAVYWGGASVCNHFNKERALYSRDNFKLNRAAALAEWRDLGAA